jgi:uncharacterized protein
MSYRPSMSQLQPVKPPGSRCRALFAPASVNIGKALRENGRAMRQVLMGIIRIYQLTLSPLLGPRCRFYPSCSCYAHTAIERHGVMRGTWLGVKRLLRCHPFAEGGYDPVPDKRLINA